MDYSWNLVGHRRAIKLLERDIRTENISHAYLFVGPGGIGRSKVAKEFAKILQCKKGGLCNNCDDCRQITKNIHIDTITVGKLWREGVHEDLEVLAKTTNIDQKYRMTPPKAKTNTIGIQMVKEIGKKMNESSLSSRKICIIHDVHRLTEEAANSLLKLIEEPPPRSVFILTTHHEDQTLPTIRSRCRQVSFGYLPDSEVQNIVQKIRPDISMKKILLFAQGRPTKALQFAKDPSFLDESEDRFQRIGDLLGKGSVSQKWTFAEELASDAMDLERFFEDITLFLRSLLLEKIEGKELALARVISFSKLIELLSKLEIVREDIGRNMNKRLALENFFLAFSVQDT